MFATAARSRSECGWYQTSWLSRWLLCDLQITKIDRPTSDDHNRHTLAHVRVYVCGVCASVCVVCVCVGAFVYKFVCMCMPLGVKLVAWCCQKSSQQHKSTMSIHFVKERFVSSFFSTSVAKARRHFDAIPKSALRTCLCDQFPRIPTHNLGSPSTLLRSQALDNIRDVEGIVSIDWTRERYYDESGHEDTSAAMWISFPFCLQQAQLMINDAFQRFRYISTALTSGSSSQATKNTETRSHQYSNKEHNEAHTLRGGRLFRGDESGVDTHILCSRRHNKNSSD